MVVNFKDADYQFLTVLSLKGFQIHKRGDFQFNDTPL